MGYMGFGMQSWIYKMTPKKPFSIDRKGSFSPLPKYKRTFKLTLKPYKGSKFLSLSISILLVVVILLFLHFYIPRFNNYSYKQEIAINEYLESERRIAFNFLYNSGMNRLRSNNLKGAYSEFKLAYNIYPKNLEIHKLLIETSNLLCDKGLTNYCSELDKWLNI